MLLNGVEKIRVSMDINKIKAGVLEVGYLEYGSPGGWPCILMHGFPYDVHAYTKSAIVLQAQGARVIIPYMRGYGPTRFLSTNVMRSGEQAAFGADLLTFMDALNIQCAVLGGYDWGGRAACIVSALWPERVTALVSGNSYNIQNISRSDEPADPKSEAAYWYQYYFHSERGRKGLERNRRAVANLLWSMWSPDWNFTLEEFEQTATSFDNPDFVEVVIHSYRHRYGLVAGDPQFADIEQKLALQPKISVPTICIDGTSDGVSGSTRSHSKNFSGPYEYRQFETAGHNLPQEKPNDWAKAIIDVKHLPDNR